MCRKLQGFGLYEPCSASVSVGLLFWKRQLQWRSMLGMGYRIQRKIGGCTMSGYEGRETRWWEEMKNVGGSCSGGSGLVYAQTVSDASTDSHNASCWSSVVCCSQAVHPKGSILSWLVHYLLTHLFPSIWIPDTLFYTCDRKDIDLSMRFVSATLFCGSFINSVAVIVLIPKTTPRAAVDCLRVLICGSNNATNV